MPENPNPAWKNQGTGPAKKKENTSVPAWKQEAGGAAGSPKSGGPRDWQRQNATQAEAARPASKVTKLVLALGLLGVLIGAAVWVVPRLRPLKPACLVLVGASYDVNLALPHNIYGWQGLQGLKDLAAEAQLHVANPAGAPAEIQDKKKKFWDEIPKSFGEQTALVFLAFHGGADSAGAYLFIDDARAQEKIYLKEVLDELPKKWKDKNIILVLEPAQVAFHWPSGMLQNHFVRELQKLKNDIEKQANLLVLCASDDGEISWPSEEWRRTIFSHYLIEGLHGAADADGDSRVTAWELFSYVKNKVSDWARTNRSAAQTPILLGRESRAQNIGLVQIDKAYKEKTLDEAPGGKNIPSTILEGAWTECARLRDQVPSPAVYTPHLWRLYRDTLVRWEQLDRAGAAANRIDILKSQRSNLEADIKNQRKAQRHMTSWELTRALSLPGVLGLAAPHTDATSTEELIKDLWQARDEEKQKERQAEFRAKVGEDLHSEQGKALYVQLCRQLIATINSEDLASTSVRSRARALVAFLERTFNLERPAEINYLVMLLSDADPDVKSADLKLAIKVRMLAEEAALAAPAAAEGRHPYSETVAAWTRSKVEEADRQRRLGEDWLFGATEKEWARARELLGQAEAKYREASEDAAVMQDALEARDKALADLPYYAEWLARRPVRDGLPSEELDKLIKQVESLSDNVGRLAWYLGRADYQGAGFRKEARPERNPDRQSPKELLQKWAREVMAVKERLEDAFEKTRLVGLPNVHQPLLWRDLDAALAVPLVKAEARKTMVAQSRDLSRKLLEARENISKEDRTADAPETQLGRQKRLALAALVPMSQDDPPTDIGKFWQQAPDKIARNFADSRQNPDLDKAAEQLREADFLCRLLPGGAVAAAVPGRDEAPYGPPQALRSLRLHDLLYEQARRARDDYWFTEIQQTRLPYYEPAALAYTRMAKELVEVAGNKAEINAARKKKAEDLAETTKKIEFQVKEPANPQYWTSELRLPLAWEIAAAKTIPEGVPMCRLDLKGPLKAAQDKLTYQRRAAKNWPPRELYLLAQPENVSAEEDKSEATFVCLYRGQEKRSTIGVQIGKPDVLVNHLPPEKSGLAFRLDRDFTYGAISIVLDCSGSMTYRGVDKNTGQLVPRFTYAIRALKATLEQIPDQTYVSVLVFVGPKNADDPNAPAYIFQWLRRPRPWLKTQLSDLIQEVESLKLNAGSPIAKALVRSRDEGFPDRAVFSGSKLIVALTDGDDNYTLDVNGFDAKKQPEARVRKYNADIRDYLQEKFAKRDIEVHVVCFNNGTDQDSREERKRAREQFKIVEQLDPRGSFTDEPEPARLASALDRAIRPKLYLYKGEQPVPGFNDKGEPISRFGPQPVFRELKPGDYTALVQKTKDFAVGRTHIGLEAGDFMILTLKRSGGATLFERSLFAEEERAKVIGEPKQFTDDTGNSLVISMLQNQIDRRNNEVSQLITLEEDPARGKEERKGQPRLAQNPHAGFVWLEVKPRGARPRELVTSWQRDYGYAAPAYSVRVQNWPAPEKAGSEVPAETTLWWATNPYPYDPAFSATFTCNLAKKNNLDSFSGPKLEQVGNAQIRMEDLAVEKHEVMTGFGKKTEECLVVRVNLDNKKPVFVQLPGAKGRLGEQHHYYSEANKYTALFWPNPGRDQVTLQVISVDDFKAESERANRWAPFGALAPTSQPGPKRVGG